MIAGERFARHVPRSRPAAVAAYRLARVDGKRARPTGCDNSSGFVGLRATGEYNLAPLRLLVDGWRSATFTRSRRIMTRGVNAVTFGYTAKRVTSASTINRKVPSC